MTYTKNYRKDQQIKLVAARKGVWDVAHETSAVMAPIFLWLPRQYGKGQQADLLKIIFTISFHKWPIQQYGLEIRLDKNFQGLMCVIYLMNSNIYRMLTTYQTQF